MVLGQRVHSYIPDGPYIYRSDRHTGIVRTRSALLERTIVPGGVLLGTLTEEAIAKAHEVGVRTLMRDGLLVICIANMSPAVFAVAKRIYDTLTCQNYPSTGPEMESNMKRALALVEDLADVTVKTLIENPTADKEVTEYESSLSLATCEDRSECWGSRIFINFRFTDIQVAAQERIQDLGCLDDEKYEDAVIHGPEIYAAPTFH
ncbi:hypothetical protein F4803DRAFT_549379 [Xylaria telfairii]|nr:hypothetical protein F4803DRAFT_549379 [Xylaria telfairii]